MKKLKTIGTYAVLILYTLIALFPIYWLATTSLKTPMDVFSTKPLGFFTPTLDNFRVVLFGDLFPQYLFNSVVISLATVLITLPIGSLAGYAFARLNIKNKDTWFFTVLTDRKSVV